MLTALPGIDEAGAGRIKQRARELVRVKVVEEEQKARDEAERDALKRTEAEAASAALRAERSETGAVAQPPSGPAADRSD